MSNERNSKTMLGRSCETVASFLIKTYEILEVPPVPFSTRSSSILLDGRAMESDSPLKMLSLSQNKYSPNTSDMAISQAL